MNESPIAAEEFAYGFDVAGLDMSSLGESLRAVVAEAMTDPARMSTWAADVMLADQTIGMNMLLRFMQEPAAPVAAPAAGDKRFADAAWSKNPLLAGMLEGYLVRARAALKLVEGTKLPEATRRKAKFALTMLTDAAAPSNIPWVNPSVVKEAYDTGGGSLMRGMQNYLEDTRSHGGKPRQVDSDSFVLGKNLAATPGRVVFRNELIELIAYQPQTARVHAVPLLCSPPWINKYYVMDLAPQRSFIEWAVRKGHQTFVVSYRNPDASMANYRLDDYLQRSLLAALDAIEAVTGSPTTNLFGLCLGGTMCVVLLAYLAAHGQAARVNAVTLTNTLVDFGDPGDFAVFTDEATIEKLERGMRDRGFLDSSQMAGTFDWMRANDLVWSYVVNNWFMGRQPPAFDILSWNADSTRMPAAMHSQYLRSFYLKNQLVKPGEFIILDTPIDLRKVDTPLYVLGAEADHIAPWRSTYATVANIGSTEIKYTLTNSGHIAGIVNPVGNPKAWYRTKTLADSHESADEWLASAEKQTGSWWEDWALWEAEHAGEMITPVDLPPGENAPGRYVVNEEGPPIPSHGN
ncbi:MAG: alpha/beta fold hydrolase [Candidatus Velthaea sp.]